MRTGRPIPTLSLTAAERETLQNWSRRPKSAQALASRARMILLCAEGRTNTRVAEQIQVRTQTVGKWRQRFVDRRLDGLLDEPRPGTPRKVSDAEVERVLTMTLESTPKDAPHWSTRSLAKESGLSRSTVNRIWRAFALQPHRSETFKLSKDPLFIDKVRDIVGLTAVWCCAWMRNLRSRLWTDPSRCCPCAPAKWNAVLTTTRGTALLLCSPPWMSRPGKSSASSTGGTGAWNSVSFSTPSIKPCLSLSTYT